MHLSIRSSFLCSNSQLPCILSMAAAATYRFISLVFFFLTLLSLFSPVLSAACSSQTFPGHRSYAFCNDLPALNSYLHWTYKPDESTLSIAFTAPPPRPEGWVSWAINPTGTRMAGSQALIAFRGGDGAMTVKTYNITGYGPLKESEVWYDVKEPSAEFSDGVMRMFATLVLPEKGLTVVNQVWQVGSSVSSGVPGRHDFGPDNLKAMAGLDLMKGYNPPSTGGNSKTKMRNIHGILNVISWGILFPVGVTIARYLRFFPSADPAWFYLHITCQISAYFIGVAGAATGFFLGTRSKGITYSAHRNIGITLLSLATLQIFASLLRPKKDHRHRVFWNIYHHSAGYTVVVLGILNCFKGLQILKPGAMWKNTYIGIIAGLGGVALVLEVITWILYCRRRKKTGDGGNDNHGQP